MTKFKDKYRVESTRLPGWDYSRPGWYFVTICTRDRLCFFGDVVDGVMCLSPVGEIVAEEWRKTSQIRPNVELDEWIVMPNHVHGIIVITAPAVETSRRDVNVPGATVGTPRRDVNVSVATVETPRRDVDVPGAMVGTPRRDVNVSVATVETPRRGVSTTTTGGLTAGSLGAIVGQIKSVCTKRIWAAGYTDFGWQSRFYDRIVRDETALERAREYIRNNPLKWKRDRNNPANVFM